MTHITESQFKKRFISLVLGGRDFPKKRENLHILLISALFGLKENYKVTTSPHQRGFARKRPFGWRPTDYIPCLP